ncbi:putative gpi anchored serine-threonine rich protein [Rosellinia necatrix]|uniref:Putative gpi anchored serine-threonine rich protein n=1 Tax=Rosellinia necatrix TaxID=77044 RepID=A0A1W2TPQ7_ROSNE|nr:putative gpi anchored serine-threonine rich protein [Rosellinia necatrix]
MRSTTIFASLLAFAASALAQDATPGYAVVSAPGNGETVPSGKTYTIQWSAGQFSGPATISLMGGNDPTTLVVLDPIATGVDVKKESFSWAVACSLGEDKTYGIKIADEASGGATFQYSFPFEIKGPSCGSDDSSSSSSSSSVSVSATHSATGYPTKKPTVTPTPTPTGYPVETTSSTKVISSSYISNSTTTTVKSSSSAYHTTTFLTSASTPVVIVTESSPVTVSGSSSVPAASTTASTPVPTAGATRAGAGLALGLFAAIFAL